jgi:hypothetical protein
MKNAWPLSLFALAGMGCASLISLPDDSPSYCARPENQAHAYCEDFDVGDPSTRWSFAFNLGPTSWSIAPSDDSPPNLIALSSETLSVDGGSAVVGFDKEFTDAGFGKLHLEADMRLVTPEGGGLAGAVGFLLITDKAGGCMALNFSALGVGGFSLVSPERCAELTTTHATALDDAGPDAGELQQVLGALPPVNHWFRVVIDVTPDTNGQGGGSLVLNIVGVPTGYVPLPIAPGTLTASGAPLVGFSNAAQPGTKAITVEYDNVTIDLPQ